MCRKMTRTVEQYMALGYTEPGARYLVARDKGEAPPAPIARTVEDYIALGHSEAVAQWMVERDSDIWRLPEYDWAMRSAVCLSLLVGTVPLRSMLLSVTLTATLALDSVGSLRSAFSICAFS